MRAVRLREHHRLVVLPEPARRFRDPGEQGESELFFDLLRRSNTRVEGFPEERERDADHDAEDDTKDAVSDRARLNLGRIACGLHGHCVLREQCDVLVQLVPLSDERLVRSRRAFACGRHIDQLCVRASLRVHIRRGVELRPVLGERS